jgi:hypothetical protein
MSTVMSSRPIACISSQVHEWSVPVSSLISNFQSAVSTRGVAPALSTGQSSTSD